MLVREMDVRSCGAVGDGKVRDTRAVQRAIDEVAGGGGGCVYFPPGEYRCGTLYLKSNVRLYLEAGAVLRGSKNKDDYERPEPRSRYDDRYLLYGRDLENVTIEGRGTIHGSGPAFWTRKMINPVVWGPKGFRPRALMYLVNCRNTLIRDVTIIDSPCFTVWLLGCDGVNVRGVNIFNNRKGPNTDALDFDCCRDIHVSDCRIEAGDDCIAIKSDGKRLGERRACENITVTNCTLSSTACGIRVGYEGDAPIRNGVFSNLVMVDTHIGIDIVSIVLDGPSSTIVEGPEIEHLRFFNIVMRNVQRPIFIWQGRGEKRPLKGYIRNVSIHHLTAETTGSCYIGGLAEKPVEGIDLGDVRLILRGRMKETEIKPPGVWGFDPVPCGLYARYVRDLRLSDVRVEDGPDAAGWQGAFRFEDVDELKTSELRGRMI